MSTLLLIDDDDGLREMLYDLFSCEGYEVVTADNGLTGLDLARAKKPDIILSDIRMPELDGHSALAEFRKMPGLEHTPVILMTGEADLPDMRKGMAGGADDYVPKPFDNRELLATVKQHLRKAQERADAAAGELNKLRTNLTSLVPADLIEPLHEIIGCASVLETDAAMLPADEVKDYANTITKSAEILNRRFENFVLFSGLEAGSLSLATGPAVAVQELVRNAAEAVARRHQRAAKLRFELAEFTAPVARELLAKIIGELVDNACRYSLASEPIDVSLRVSDATYTINVTDYGDGMSEETLKEVETATPHQGSYGVTLARRLTEALGGIWGMENRPKRGVSINLMFPRN